MEISKGQIYFKHSGNLGDIIYSLPAIKQQCDKHLKQATLFIKLNVASNFTDAQHPVGAVMMNQTMFDMAKPLLESQSYIKNVVSFTDESTPAIDFDLDLFRKDNVNLSAGNISQWICNSYPELRPNLYEPSLIIPKTNENYIIVNRTQRYQNIYIDYSVLEKYKNVYFVGVEKEFKALRNHNPNIEHLEVDNFYQLAQWIAGSKLFIGNQSMAFAIAEQLKVRRVLEQFVHVPNVIPQGGEYWVTHNMNQFKSAIGNALSGGENTDQGSSQNKETETSN